MLLFFLFISSSAAAPRFALILSGGGARGLAQIGVLKAMEANDIKPDLIVATSMGAIIGTLYAAGYSADSIESLARMVDWNKIFSNSSHRKTLFVSQKNEPSSALFELRFNYNFKPILPTSISYGQSFYDELAPLLVIPQAHALFDFDSLPIPLRIIATDLLTGNKVIFSEGNLCTAIRASCSVPLAFSPVETGTTLLIDGGVSENIPAATARQMGAKIVVAVDVTSPYAGKEELDNPVKLIDQIMAIGAAQQKARGRSQADMIITPHLFTIKNTDFEKIDSLIALGFKSAHPLCDSIISLLRADVAPLAIATDTDGPHPGTLQPHKPASTEKPSLSSPAETPPLLRRNTSAPIIRGTITQGNRRTSDRVLINGSGLKTGDTITSSAIRKSISSLYATTLFENVNLDIDSAGTCRIMVEEKKYWRVRMGLRFDEFHLGEGYLEPAFENCFGLGIIALLHLHYGLRREKYTVEVHSNQFFSRNFTNNIQMQIYSSKEKIQEVVTTIGDSTTMISTTSLMEHTLRKTGFSLYLGAQLGRFTLLSGGMRFERFKVQQKEPDMLRDLLGTGFKKFLPYFSIRLTMDSMDKYPYATSGIRQFLSIGGANRALGGGRYSFLKCSGSVGRYFTLFRYHTFFPSFSFSWANDKLPQVERPYLGGAITQERYQEMSVYNYTPFYGLPPRAVTGDLFGICHFEYRCELKRNLFAHLLFDWGTAWDHGIDDYRNLINDAPLGIGVGLSYMTPLGPLRLSYGQLLKNSEHYLLKRSEFFYFSGGYDF